MNKEYQQPFKSETERKLMVALVRAQFMSLQQSGEIGLYGFNALEH